MEIKSDIEIAQAADLRPIYQASTAEEAARQLDGFEEKWAGNSLATTRERLSRRSS